MSIVVFNCTTQEAFNSSITGFANGKPISDWLSEDVLDFFNSQFLFLGGSKRSLAQEGALLKSKKITGLQLINCPLTELINVCSENGTNNLISLLNVIERLKKCAESEFRGSWAERNSNSITQEPLHILSLQTSLKVTPTTPLDYPPPILPPKSIPGIPPSAPLPSKLPPKQAASAPKVPPPKSIPGIPLSIPLPLNIPPKQAASAPQIPLGMNNLSKKTPTSTPSINLNRPFPKNLIYCSSFAAFKVSLQDFTESSIRNWDENFAALFLSQTFKFPEKIMNFKVHSEILKTTHFSGISLLTKRVSDIIEPCESEENSNDLEIILLWLQWKLYEDSLPAEKATISMVMPNFKELNKISTPPRSSYTPQKSIKELYNSGGNIPLETQEEFDRAIKIITEQRQISMWLEGDLTSFLELNFFLRKSLSFRAESFTLKAAKVDGIALIAKEPNLIMECFPNKEPKLGVLTYLIIRLREHARAYDPLVLSTNPPREMPKNPIPNVHITKNTSGLEIPSTVSCNTPAAFNSCIMSFLKERSIKDWTKNDVRAFLSNSFDFSGIKISFNLQNDGCSGKELIADSPRNVIEAHFPSLSQEDEEILSRLKKVIEMLQDFGIQNPILPKPTQNIAKPEYEPSLSFKKAEPPQDLKRELPNQKLPPTSRRRVEEKSSTNATSTQPLLPQQPPSAPQPAPIPGDYTDLVALRRKILELNGML